MNEGIFSVGNKIEIKEFPMPKLQSEMVMIRQEFCGLNYDDIKVLTGRIANPNPRGILGVEASGIIVAVSPDCKKGFKVGDKVCYATYNPGAFVNFRCVHENYLIPLSENFKMETGATLLKGLLAYTVLGKVFTINPPAFIMLTGASGAVGSIITQLASKARLKVIAITSNENKKEYIKSNGAFAVINYKTENVALKILEITNGVGVDYFFDCLGKDSENFALESIKKCGFFLQFGAITGEIGKINLETQKQKSITATRIMLGNYISNRNNLLKTSFAFIKSIEAEVIRPKITTYSFKKSEQAFLDIKNGVSLGQKIFSL